MLLVLAPLSVILLASACRYYLIWSRFKIPEHLMMMAGMIIASPGFLIIDHGIPSLLLGCGILGWGFTLWLGSQIEILSNSKWRRIRRRHSRRNIWLLRFRPGLE